MFHNPDKLKSQAGERRRAYIRCEATGGADLDGSRRRQTLECRCQEGFDVDGSDLTPK